MKMKIGRNPSTQTILRHLVPRSEVCEVSAEEDLARVAAVRKVLGPHGKLTVDANCAWSPAFAIAMEPGMAAAPSIRRKGWFARDGLRNTVVGADVTEKRLVPGVFAAHGGLDPVG
jgi:hypothetical protein